MSELSKMVFMQLSQALQTLKNKIMQLTKADLLLINKSLKQAGEVMESGEVPRDMMDIDYKRQYFQAQRRAKGTKKANSDLKLENLWLSLELYRGLIKGHRKTYPERVSAQIYKRIKKQISLLEYEVVEKRQKRVQNQEDVSDKYFFDFSIKIARISLIATACLFDEQHDKTPPENIPFLETLLKPPDQVDAMDTFDLVEYNYNVIENVEGKYVQAVKKRGPEVSNMMRQWCLISLHSAVEVYLQDLILELYDRGIIKDEDINVGARICPKCQEPIKQISKEKIKENNWRPNKKILESLGFSFYQIKEFEKINQSRINILHRGDRIEIAASYLKEKFSYVKKLVQTFENQVQER